MRWLPILGATAILALSGCHISLTTTESSTTSLAVLDEAIDTTTPPASLAEYLGSGSGSGAGLVPESKTEGDRSVIDLSFTDGRRVEIVYPSSWPLDQYGWTPDTDIVYEFDEPRDDGSSVIHAQLIFSYGTDGEWTASIHPMSVWSSEELAVAESHFTLHEESNGFVTVETTRPLSHHTRDPDQAPSVSDFKGEAGIYVDDILGLASTGTCVDDPQNPYPLRESHGITWCDEDAGVTVAFLVPTEYHDEILSNVDMRLVTAGPGG